MPKAAEEDDVDGGILDDPIEEESSEEEGLEAADEDEGQDEGQEDEEGAVAARDDGVEAEEKKPATRGERRFQNLSRALKEQKDRADRIERQLSEAQARQPERRETEQEKAARYALMSPEERVEARLSEATQGFQQQMAAMQIQQQNAQDLMGYQAKAATNPRMARYAGEVEQEFQKAVAKGSFVSREVIYHYILGRKVDQQANGAKKKQAQKGKQAIQRQTTRPTNGRADVQTQRRGGKTLAERLADVEI